MRALQGFLFIVTNLSRNVAPVGGPKLNHDLFIIDIIKVYRKNRLAKF